MQRNGRITLISRNTTKPDMDWNYAACRGTSVAFVESVVTLGYALEAAVVEVDLDVERVIVDRACGGDEFLQLLTGLPAEYNGDVVLIRDDGTGVMSASARGETACSTPSTPTTCASISKLTTWSWPG